MVHFFPLTIKGARDDEPSCERLHSIKLREMNSVPAPKIFGGSKHLTPLLNTQKLFHDFVGWKHFSFFLASSVSPFLHALEKKKEKKHNIILASSQTKMVDGS